MGVNSDDLVQAAADVTAGAGELVDLVYGKRTSNFPMPTVANGPFHAIKMAPSIVMTTGGLKANIWRRAACQGRRGVERPHARGYDGDF